MRENTAARLKQIMEERKLKQVDILNLSLPYCKKYEYGHLLYCSSFDILVVNLFPYNLSIFSCFIFSGKFE